MKRILLTLIYVLAVVGAMAGNVVFKKIWLEHNVQQNGQKGMKVHVAFSISGMQGQTCSAIAYFDHPQGTGVRDTNGRYCTTGGTVCASRTFNPNYANASFSDFAIFIPISELHLLPGKRTYYTRVFIQSPSGNFMGNSDYASFDGTGSSSNDSYASNQKANNQYRSCPYCGQSIIGNNYHSCSGSRNKNQGRNNVQQTHQNSKLQSSHVVSRTREEIQMGFVITEVYSNGFSQRTTYYPCTNCRGSKLCQSCRGARRCGICNGQGGIISAGMGNYYPCYSCNSTGFCSLCKGSGSCICTSSDYPGYMPWSGDSYYKGQSLGHDRYYDSKGTSSDDKPVQRKSSTTKGCSQCKRGVNPYPQSVQPSTSWIGHYNSSGVKCPYCDNYNTSSHWHEKCSSCNTPLY